MRFRHLVAMISPTADSQFQENCSRVLTCRHYSAHTNALFIDCFYCLAVPLTSYNILDYHRRRVKIKGFHFDYNGSLQNQYLTTYLRYNIMNEFEIKIPGCKKTSSSLTLLKKKK